MLSFGAGYRRDDLLGVPLTGPGAIGFWLTWGLDANEGLIPDKQERWRNHLVNNCASGENISHEIFLAWIYKAS